MCTDFKVDKPCTASVTSLIASGSPLRPEPTAAITDETAPLAAGPAGADAELAADAAVLAAAAAGPLVAAAFGDDFFEAHPESAIALMRMPTATGRTETNRVMRPPR